MPTSDNPAFPDGCYLCERNAGTLHHISYHPEIVVLVCSNCHGAVHAEGYDGTPKHPELNPDMSRTEWKREQWNGEDVPRPTAKQIEWTDNSKGVVHR